jgi:hypothetical protein
MRPCSLGAIRPVRFAFLSPLVFTALPALVAAAVPNPSFSTCVFPETIPGTLAAVTVQVTVQKDATRPVPGAYVQVNILVDSGTLAPGQATAVSALSDAEGHATVVFSEGVSGEGMIRFQVHADGILLCTSEVYPLGTVPVLPSTWGHLKAIYASKQ